MIINCKYCRSEKVRKFGTYKGVQRYFCNDCKRKFISDRNIPNMQYPTYKVAYALQLYYQGTSLHKIRRKFILNHNDYISDVTPLNWVRRFTGLAVMETDKYKPQVGSNWIVYETVLNNGDNKLFILDIMDIKTRFLIASHMSVNETAGDIEKLLLRASDRTGKLPEIIYTDKLKPCLDGIAANFYTANVQNCEQPFIGKNSVYLLRRFHTPIGDRSKAMKHLYNIQSIRQFLDGWLVYYNFFKQQVSLQNQTPAALAGIQYDFRNWKDIIELVGKTSNS